MFSAHIHAGKDDFTKKIELASEYQNADGIAKRASYQGNVVIQQGSLKVSANELMPVRERAMKYLSPLAILQNILNSKKMAV